MKTNNVFRIKLALIPLLCVTTLTVTSVFASNNKTAVASLSQSPTDKTEQYKVTFTTDNNVESIHVELLPDENGEYWIPKGYKVKITANCTDGYEQSTGQDTYTISEAKNIDINTDIAPPSEEDLLREEIATLQQTIGERNFRAVFNIYGQVRWGPGGEDNYNGEYLQDVKELTVTYNDGNLTINSYNTAITGERAEWAAKTYNVGWQIYRIELKSFTLI